MTCQEMVRDKKTLTGFTLIEVLIALVVMTIGMLGLSALYIESLRLNRSAIYRHAAIGLAADVAEHLRASGRRRISASERSVWERQIRNRLPNGSRIALRPTRRGENGLISGTSLERYDIQLEWPEPGRETPDTYSLAIYLSSQ